MERTSPSQTIKQLDDDVRRLTRKLLDSHWQSKNRLTDLFQNLHDARIHTQDYELAETKEEQINSAKQARQWLTKARQNILSSSQEDIFSAIDVASLSARIDQVISDLK